MALLCYVTNQIKEDASKQGTPKDSLAKFAHEVEQRQSLAGFDHFPPACLTKKKLFRYNNRLIATEKQVGEHLVVVLLRLVVRGDNEYTEFLRDPPTWAGRYYDTALNAAKLKAWVAQRTEQSPPEPPPVMSDAEKTFLWSDAYPENYDDVMVCETNEWISDVNKPRIADRLIRLPEMIVAAMGAPKGAVQTVRSPSDNRLAIQAINFPNTRQCVLVSASYDQSDTTLKENANAWEDQLSAADSETVLRFSRRSYPSIICCDDDMWIAIQKDQQANLALSPEEAEILRASTAHDTSTAALPLFINGRAGSGKSTLLQYLFAQYFLRWGRGFPHDSTNETRPLYLASSRELLKVARDVVDSLLSANHQQLLAPQQGDEALLGHLAGCFRPFMEFMFSQLDENEADRFSQSSYVSYARFRRMWVERFGHERRALREFGPQISWHVIRGLIKGMSIDDTLDKSDYDELPEGERTVSRNVYESVHDKVWRSWYDPLCRSGKVWDSQDLVRFLLDHNRLSASHTAVFCDEAQDFTRLELEAIYHCSLFSERQIDFESLKRVPFVFAGDPFQTLNPTGFRWESVRAAFTERILRSLYRFSSKADVPLLNYQELTYNYRSSKRIVQFCNSIQATRAGLFGHPSLHPQSTWQLGEDPSPPAFFEKGDVQMERALQDHSDLVLIVPCEEGEEVDFVANDAYLNRIVQSDEDGTPRNILSAARAKGLEFLRVALYGWSATEEAHDLSKIMRSPDKAQPSIDAKLALEYYLNNLYVAASRARRRLFIIDERDALDGLWWFASDESHLSAITSKLPQKAAWDNHTGLFVRGVPENFSEDRDDPKAIANRFEHEGRSKEDSYLLRQAALQYTLGVDETKAHECRAVADCFDGRFLDSGKQFILAGLPDEAVNAFWQGKHYAELDAFAGTHPDVAKHARCRLSAFITSSDRTVRACCALFQNLVDNANVNDELKGDLKTSLWKGALQKAVERSLEEDRDAKAEDARVLADLVGKIQAYGWEMDASILAGLLFKAERYDDVLATLKSDDGSNLYRDAKALSLISHTKSEGQPHEPADARVIGDYHYRKNEFELASGFYRQAGDWDRTLDCLRHSVQSAGERGIAKTLENSLATLIANGEWLSLICLLKEGRPYSGKKDKWAKAESEAVLRQVREGRVVLEVVIPELASSDLLNAADGKAQQRVSEFLAGQLMEPKAIASWWKDLPRAVAGAAIERAGRHIDALEFYERWRDSATSAADREYAERRWVICKLRQANHEDSEGYAKKADGYRQAAERVMRKYGWDEQDVPDGFPNVERWKGKSGQDQKRIETAAKAVFESSSTNVQGRLGDIAYRYIAAKGWVNLESDDGSCARILVREKGFTSDDVRVSRQEDGTFECPDWKLQVCWLSPSKLRIAQGGESRDIAYGESGNEAV